MSDKFFNFTARVILVLVVVSAIIYKNSKRLGNNTHKFIKDHPPVEETLTVAMFVGGIGLVLALAIPGSHLVVGALY